MHALSRLAHALDRAHRHVVLLGRPGSEGRAPRELEGRFQAACRELASPRVLELGIKQSVPGRSTAHRDWVPHAAEFLGTDMEAGVDVDLVADLHSLSSVAGRESFDVVISCSTFEHLKYPGLAAHEILKTLRVGGLVFVQTHQSFPLHGYPFDYFRFSREALASLFGSSMGFEVVETGYDFPARIYTRREPQAHRHPAFLNTTLWGRKHAPTPDAYRYEL